MNVLQSVGFAYGVAVVAMVPVSVVVLLVPSWRRRLVTGPLRRRLARRRPQDTMRITLPYTRPQQPRTFAEYMATPEKVAERDRMLAMIDSYFAQRELDKAEMAAWLEPHPDK